MASEASPSSVTSKVPNAWREEPLAATGLPPSTVMPRTADAVAAAVVANESVVVVDAFATPVEVEMLLKEGDRAERESLHNPLTSDSTRLRIEVYGREFPNQRSVPMLAAPVRALTETLVRRAIAFVQAELPALAHSVGLASCRAETKLRYSEGEPGINIYTGPGGSFQPHMDMQALTLLVPLSSAGLDYEGGGTAFYAPDAQLGDARRGKISPIALLRPEAGHAMLWNGTLLHAGAEVTSGRRLVFVASFTPCDLS